MPKQVRHDRSVVTLNNILSRQSTACCHCTLHTCAKLAFSNVAQATYRKNFVLKLLLSFLQNSYVAIVRLQKRRKYCIFDVLSHPYALSLSQTLKRNARASKSVRSTKMVAKLLVCRPFLSHTLAKLVFSNVAQATYGKNYVLEITSFPFRRPCLTYRAFEELFLQEFQQLQLL